MLRVWPRRKSFFFLAFSPRLAVCFGRLSFCLLIINCSECFFLYPSREAEVRFHGNSSIKLFQGKKCTPLSLWSQGFICTKSSSRKWRPMYIFSWFSTSRKTVQSYLKDTFIWTFYFCEWFFSQSYYEEHLIKRLNVLAVIPWSLYKSDEMLACL